MISRAKKFTVAVQIDRICGKLHILLTIALSLRAVSNAYSEICWVIGYCGNRQTLNWRSEHHDYRKNVMGNGGWGCLIGHGSWEDA